MAKRPENMTPDERLARIRSLERKVFDLEHRLAWAEQERKGTIRWGQSAFTENRRLTDRLRELIERIPSIVEPEVRAHNEHLAEMAARLHSERTRADG